MKTALILILLCVGLGFGIATSEISRRTAGIKHVYGVVEDMDAALAIALKEEPKDLALIEVVGGPELDFGTMKKGTRRSHKFVFKNVGESSADVWFKTSSCKCTVGKFEKATLKPGETTEVELEWIVEGLGGDFAQTATIGTSAPRQEEIKLTIKGRIGEALMFEPSILDLGEFMSNETHEFKGRLFSFEELPLEVPSASVGDTSISSKFKVSLEQPRKPEPNEFPNYGEARQVLEFKVTIEKGVPSGNISTNLMFARYFKNGESESIPLKIIGRCVNPIRIIAGNDYDEERDVLKMGSGTTKEGLKKSFLLAVKTTEYPDANITFNRVTPESISDKVKVVIGEPQVTKSQKIFPITVEIPAGTEPVELNGLFGKDFGKVVFDTNMENSPEESIYLQFKISE
ncbi:MAG: DUF1573 domain-containing protein [Pirellula sp.]|jgi:hypothetical protein|nr:DUF1573 domain-containing protein [Pirellula sp.]